GKMLTKTVFNEKLPVAWDDFVANPAKPEDGLYNAAGYLKEPTKVKFKQKPPLRKCPECGAALLRPALKSRGETNQSPRWYAALILKKLKKHFDLYIADEVHQTKAEDSGRGFAFAELVKASKRTLCLTGTLVNGMSTSIKEILWRTDPGALIEKGFNHKTGMVGWASRYGVLEKITKIREYDDGIHTRRRRYQNVTVREKPGISPELAADHLLHQAVFIELPDIGLPLVKIKEVPVFVALDEKHYKEYKKFHENLHEICKEAYRNGSKGAFAKFIPSTINAVDRADAGLVVEVDNLICEFPAFGGNYYSAKERKLVQLIKENLAEGRGCFVYCNYTDRYGVHRRVEKVLKDHGIESAVLESHVSQEERVSWLADQAKKGTKVIICNMRLVETGLDLLPWPTLIFYQLSYDINTVRQASRRAWRIGQTRECRIYYLVADGTQQLAQFEVCMEKRANALLTEGRLDRSELSRYVRKKQAMIAADIAECIASEDIGTLWTELAAKDIEDVETVEEDRFREVLRAANERLANETLRLCGIAEEEIETAEVKTEERPSYADLLVFVPVRTRRKKKKSAVAEEP
ncbi:MAG: helicase-related protein, partial [Desulfotomaculales bacterium]